MVLKDETHEAEQTVDYLELHAQLEGSDPPVWRQFYIPSIYSFFDLHLVLQSIFGWGQLNDHVFIYGFAIGDPNKRLPRALDEHLLMLEQMVDDQLSFVYECTLGERQWVVRITRTDTLFEGEPETCLPELTGGEGFPDGVTNFLGQPRVFDLAVLDKNLDGLPYAAADDYKSAQVRQFEVNYIARRRFDVVKFVDYSQFRQIVSIEKLTVDEVHLTEQNRPPDYKQVVSMKNGGSVMVRPELEPVIFLLDVAGDVPGFRTFPVVAKFEEGGERDSFFFDLQIRGKNRAETNVVVCTSERDEMIGRWLIAEGVAVTVLSTAFLKDVVLSNCREVLRHRRVDVPDTDRVFGPFGQEKTVDMSYAISRMYNDRAYVIGGVALGKLGMDFSLPIDSTRIGRPTYTGKTTSFWSVARKYIVG
jgi:hypothetical protein